MVKTTAIVKLYGEEIGAVSWLEEGYATFAYSSGILEKGMELAPFNMNTRNGRNKGPFAFQQLKHTSFKGLPGLLADSLPDTYGNTLVNRWLNTKGQAPNSLNPVEMLLYTGNRAMGALEFVPAFHKTEKSSVIKVEQVFKVVNTMLAEKAGLVASLEEEEADSIGKIILMGSSVGGARAKALIAWNEQSNEVMSGHTDVVEGFSHWILKFDGIKNNVLGSPEGFGRIEMAYYEMAKAAGITMMPSRLYEESGRAHFMTRRFDRIGSHTKIHFQSQYGLRHLDYLGSAIGYAHSYEQLFETMRGLRLPYSDAEEMFRRMIFNITTCNVDDHTKNFGFLMHETGKWQLAPAYDLTFTYNPSNLGGTQHSLSLNNKRSGFTKHDFAELAEDCNIRNWEKSYNQVLEAVKQWPEIAAKFLVKDEFVKVIGEAMDGVGRFL